MFGTVPIAPRSWQERFCSCVPQQHWSLAAFQRDEPRALTRSGVDRLLTALPDNRMKESRKNELFAPRALNDDESDPGLA